VEKFMTANQVVAYSPTELATAQLTVRGWCAENIRHLLAERREAEANLETAKASKWRTDPFRKIVNKCGRRIEYYKKLGAAIKLGYMIVPNFDMELFAVRTSKAKPRHEKSRWQHERFPQIGETLPEGEGRYVDETPYRRSQTYQEGVNAKGEPVKVTDYWPTKFDEELAFPVALVKPHIIAETSRAMGYKLFDQIGVARGGVISSGSRRDPIVLGRIWDRTRKDQCVSFFIAWWLDKEML
jgi:hypothetical protein